ncbi:MAG: right-handed parallel beta-helix repeat-containing protein [Lunatimonas sp.]|uniref:malectin domain-containing carbohydrate-binding protein n=1 Tax=Lunatimonas sp. TaxID=2060141 RepID=UPI00263A56F7|nr:malectin domain-containing carbohydrate-binding protein [Lunatimonas sp.]MCC5939719.1 right-handed parallel beta-helix repeat-containing protein [Lunatimonas sp.]
MKTKAVKLMMLAWLAFFCQSAFAVDYYFSDISGDDNRTSTQAQNPSTPWKSVAKLNQIFPNLKGGDNIFFKRGERFYGTIHITNSGSPGNPIKIGAYGTGPKPIITSFRELKDWNNLGNSIFESKSVLATGEVNVVLVNGKRVELGRFPNANTSNEGYITIATTNGSNTVSGTFPSGSSNWQNAEVVIKKVQWVIDTHKVTNHSGSTITFDNSGSSYSPKEGFGFFIQNHPNTLDQFGEWYFSPSTKKLRLFFGNVNTSSAKVEYASLPYLLTKNSRVNHIVLENLHLSGANKDAIYFSGNGDDLKIKGVDVEFTGENGMHILSHTNLEIDGSSASSTYNNGMFLRFGNPGAIIRNNSVNDAASIPGRNANGDGSGVGIFAVSENILIERNKVTNIGYNGIQFNGTSTVVRQNFIDTFCLIKGDGGGVYTYGGHNNPDTHGRKIERNIILNGIGSKGGLAYMTRSGFNPQAEGIFLDDNSNGIEIIGNTIANANSGIKMSNSYNVQVRNNTIFNSNMLLNIGNSNIGKDTRNITIEGNTFFSKYADQNSYTFRSYKNDISQMVELRNNTFFRPFGDEFSIYTRNPNSSGTFVENFYNLDRWAKEMGKDTGSKSNTVDFEKFVVKEKTGNNLFPNQGFDKNTSGVGPNSSTVTWSKDGIEGGTLQVRTGSTSSSLKIDIGQVSKDKTYLVRFKAKGERKAPLRVYFRHTGSPWANLSSMTTFELDTRTTEFQTILTPQIDLEKTSLMIATSETNLTYLLDDLEIVSVNVHNILPEEKILFEYNNQASIKTIALNGSFVNAQKELFTGKVDIQPFSSVALFKLGNDLLDEQIEEIENTEETEEVVEEVEENVETVDGGDEPQKEAPSNTPIETGDSNVTRLFMNLGSSEAVDFAGNNFEGENLNCFVSTSSISNNVQASNEPLFQNGRFGSTMVLTIPVSNGTYTVKTYHHETYFGMNGRPGGSNRRVFDIALQGTTVKKDFDLFLENANQETVLTFHQVNVTNNVLNITLTASVNNAIISGISITEYDESSLADKPVEDKTTPAPSPEQNIPAIAVNTFRNAEISYQGVGFGAQSNYLKTSSTGISTNLAASKEPLFQAGRFATHLAYEIPVTNGKYQVKTYHHETYFGKTGPTARSGQRVFDILVEGQVVKRNLDMFVEFANKEIELDLGIVEIKDNILNLDLRATANNAIISGFMLVPITETTEKTSTETIVKTSTETQPIGIYFSTGSQGNVSYQNASFSRIPADYLKTSGTNISNNSTASTEPLFISGRFAPRLNYAIPVPNGIYTVETYHKETYFGLNGRDERAGQRVFDILVEGVKVKSNLDMFAEFRNKEVKLTFKNISVTDGTLNLDFIASVNNAIVAGIGIVDETGRVLFAGNNMRGYREMEQAQTEDVVQVLESKTSALLYPNPANEYTNLVVDSDSELQFILIHNMAGQLVKAIHPADFVMGSNRTITISTADLKNGTYLLSVSNKKGEAQRLRFIVQH